MNNTEQRHTIKAAWEFVQGITHKKRHMAIAGGAVADIFFNKSFTDIDVFISSQEEDAVIRFAEEHGFEEVEVPQFEQSQEDSYGNVYRSRIGSMLHDVNKVFKGSWNGYPMDLVIVGSSNIATHVTTCFDQSIKACWYDGKFNYSDVFMETVATGMIKPIRPEANGYVRAWLSANKYDLKISPEYELSKDYIGYAYHNQHDLHEMMSDTTVTKLENYADSMFKFEPRLSNAILMDVFLKHQRENTDLYYKLVGIAEQDVVSRHPLHGHHTQIELNLDTESSKFITLFTEVIKVMKANGHNEENGDLITDIIPLLGLKLEDYINGKFRDSRGREVRIGKHIGKLRRNFQKKLDLRYDHFFDSAIKMLETRSNRSSVNIFFTGSKQALTTISTNTKWTSCQRWEGLTETCDQNYGLLANVSGSSLVVYMAEERCDEDSSKWDARALIRIGEAGDLMIEKVYTHLGEINNSMQFTEGVKEHLRSIGYAAYTFKEEALDFRSLPMWSRPYQDTDATTVIRVDGMYFFRGLRQEVERRKMIEEFNYKVSRLVAKTEFGSLKYGLDFYLLDERTRAAVIELPEELVSILKKLCHTGYLRHLVHSDPFLHTPTKDQPMWIDRYIFAEEEDGEFWIVIKESLNRARSEKLRVQELMRKWEMEGRTYQTSLRVARSFNVYRADAVAQRPDPDFAVNDLPF